MQRTVGSDGSLHYCNYLKDETGETPDISQYIEFEFYDRYWYNDNAGLGETKLGKWWGVSHRIGSIMSY